MINFQWIGIDIAKNSFNVALINEHEIYCDAVFPNNSTGYKKFLHWLHQKTQSPWVCLEATGHYSELLADFLHQQLIRVSVVNPYQIKQFARLTLTRNKNDIVDARVIAQFCQKISPALFTPRPPQQKQLRELIQLLDTLKAQKVQLNNQLYCLQDATAKKIFTRQIKRLEQEIQTLAEKIKLIAKSNDPLAKHIDSLLAIKGIGEISALRILAYLPNVKHFKHAKQLAAFVGLTPRQQQSGRMQGKTYLSKLGNPRLRKALYMPALSAKRYNEHFKPFVQRLEKNGLKPKAIVAALMRKIIHIIFGMFKNEQPFNPALV